MSDGSAPRAVLEKVGPENLFECGIGCLGGRLVRACLQKAREGGYRGAAAFVSEGPWMAGQGVFHRNGFETVDEKDRFQLVIHRLEEGPEPKFRDLGHALGKYQGLNLIYSAQCPMLPKSANDLAGMAAEHGLELKITVLGSAREAQNAPSYYGVFNLV